MIDKKKKYTVKIGEEFPDIEVKIIDDKSKIELNRLLAKETRSYRLFAIIATGMVFMVSLSTLLLSAAQDIEHISSILSKLGGYGNIKIILEILFIGFNVMLSILIIWHNRHN